MHDASITFRLPTELLNRAERLIPKLKRHGSLAAMTISKATVLRLALLRGLDSLEAEVRPPKRKTAKK